MADYDGITEREEGKKKIPLGMLILFWGLVVSGLLYLYLFTPLFSGWTQVGRYEKKMQSQSDAEAPAVQKKTVTAAVVSNKERAKRGKEIYDAMCAMCHGENLEGGAGSALTGPTFQYGDSLQDHIRVITKGTPKGMPGFESSLGPEKVRNVSLYIHSQH
ncbi:MAG TPA: hypothetical protein DCO77_00905 [Nitrospiraceae bacterium]|nr:hypothetical protein [Nitrospiraceae bacterium]